MVFRPVISRFGEKPDALADALGLPTKNVRRWVDNDSIPADWFNAVERAAKSRGFRDITVRHLASLAEQRRIDRAKPVQQDAEAAA